jgi:Transposase IS66 family
MRSGRTKPARASAEAFGWPPAGRTYCDAFVTPSSISPRPNSCSPGFRIFIGSTPAPRDRLTPFVDHPEIWLDNNPTERGIRGPVLGRRNHLGSKSSRGTEVAAILYSWVESAKASGIDPIAYLTEVATRAKESPSAVVLPADFVAERCAL